MRAKKNAGLRVAKQQADWAGAALPAPSRRASILNERSHASREQANLNFRASSGKRALGHDRLAAALRAR
jgi:hypothetical protein